MRLKVISATLIVLFSFPLVLPQQRKSTKSDPCSKAMTQAGLQSCYCDRAQKADAQGWPVPGDEAAGTLRETLGQAKAEAGPGQEETSQGDEAELAR